MSGIEVRNVTKTYGRTIALNDLSVDFGENKIYGLLGRNGAGKTTLLNIINNRIFADSGRVSADGESCMENDKVQSKMYLMSEKTYYPEKMKVKDVYKWTKNFYPDFDMEYADQLAVKFSLDTDKRVDSLSTGYNSIVKLIAALCVNTPYVFFDEPVLGLDANYRDLFYRLLIEKYSMNPSTMILSTHLIGEVSGVVEHVVIINKGRIIRNESTEKLLSNGYTVTGTAARVDEFVMDKNIIGCDVLGGLKTAYILGEHPVTACEGIEISKMDLQKLFVKLTNDQEA